MEPGRPAADRPGVPIDANAAELLPVRYRETLDIVDHLMDIGGRLDAIRLRAQAIEVYAGAWDANCLRRMEEILARAVAACAACEAHGLCRVA